MGSTSVTIYGFEMLKNPGDSFKLYLEPKDKSFRTSLMVWCQRYQLKIKVEKFEKYGVELTLLEGEFTERKPKGPAPRFPELATMQVGDFRDYEYLYPPVNGSYLPVGIISAMRREKRKGKDFEYFNASSGIVRVMRIS